MKLPEKIKKTVEIIQIPSQIQRAEKSIKRNKLSKIMKIKIMEVLGKLKNDLFQIWILKNYSSQIPKKV